MESASQTEIAAQLLAHRAWLRELARRLAAAGESDDLAQETWVAALEGSPEVRGGLRPWIAGVVRHLASGLRRKHARRAQRERSAARPEALPSTVELVERVDTEERLARALLALDEPVRTTLLLRFHEGLSAAEIARSQGVPDSTVRWRCKIGLDELRARLAKEFGDREALGLALAGLLRAQESATGITGQGATSSAGGATAMIVTKVILIGSVALAAGLGFRRSFEPRAVASATAARASAVQEAQLAGAPAGAELAALASPGPQDSNHRALAGAPVTRLRVLESDGRPNADLAVAVAAVPGEPHALVAATDADGWVEFPASGERRRLAVERVETFPFRTELEFVPGEATLQLPAPEGGDLAGQVRVDGLAPARPLWLLLHAASSAAVDLDVSDSSWPLDQDVTSSATDADGRFRFRGIAAGRDVNLRAPEGHARQGLRSFSDPGAGAVFHFAGPAADLQIELERFPSVRGRVLETDGHTPVADATVEIQFDGSLWGRQTGSDGTFEIFAAQPPEHLRVKYGRRREWHALDVANPTTTAEFTFPEPRPDIDLGDLLLVPSPGFFLEVRDSAGQPLEGAEVGACTETPTNVTDPTGRSWIAGLAPGTELALTRRGHRSAFVTLPDPLPETLSVVLAPANDLALEVRGADGEPLAGVRLELAAPGWFLTTGEPVSDAWHRTYQAGAGPGSWWRYWERNRAFEGRRGSNWSRAPTRIQFSADGAGRCSLGEILPDIALHLTVLDDVGAVLHEEELAPLGAEEQRLVHVRLDTPVSAVCGRVTSETGQPLAGASVTLGLAGGEETSSRGTQADGRFRFTRVAQHELRLTVTKAGYLARELDRFWPSAEELELVLARGYDVTVLVRDASGRPHAGGTVRVRRPGEARSHRGAWTFADARGDGLFELGGLPGEPREIVVELPAGILQETWTPPQREVVIFVPDGVGTVELALRDPGSFPESFRPWLEPRGGGGRREVPLAGAQTGLIRFEQFAGEYDLVAEHEVGAMGGLQLTNRSVLRSFTVVAGETVRIEFP